MSRDWDKMRRQDRAKKPDLYGTMSTAWKKANMPKAMYAIHKTKAVPQDCERVLTIHMHSCTVLSRWQRKEGKWRCAEADELIEWFVRIRHPEVIEEWVRDNGFRFAWSKPHAIHKHGKKNKSTDGSRTSGEKQLEPRAEKGCGAASLNIYNPAALRGPTPQATSGLEQNGYTDPHCLIATHCSVEPETRSTIR